MLLAAATEQSVVQLHLMIFNSSAGAGGFLVAIGCKPIAVHVQPQSFSPNPLIAGHIQGLPSDLFEGILSSYEN